MSVHPFPGSPEPDPLSFVAADASLHGIATFLTERLVVGELEPAVISVELTDDEGFDVRLKPLEGEHPSSVLLGMTAPSEWDNLGVVASGRLFDLADPTVTRGRVAMTAIVSRRGEVAHSANCSDGRVFSGGDEMAGLTLDLLRRALGLSTDPPPCGTNALFALHWLLDVVGLAERGGAKPTWHDLVAVHPAIRLLRRAERVADADLIEVARAYANVCTWSMLRRLLDEERFEVRRLVPGDGAWFDDGSFARHVLTQHPPLRLVRSKVGDVLSKAMSTRISTVLDELDVPHQTWPDQPGDVGRRVTA